MNENAKTKLVLEYTGMDDFSCPVYKDQFGKLWKDIDLGKEPEPNLYSLSFNHIDGEPSHPIQQEYTFHPAPYQRSSYEFEYRMLSKLQSAIPVSDLWENHSIILSYGQYGFERYDCIG